MSKPTKEDIATIINGFEKFFEHMSKTQGFNLQEFVNFMEPKFTAAGYRDKMNKVKGGNILILTEIGVGDFIVATGAIREIRRIYPDAYISLILNPRTMEIGALCPYVDEIILNHPKHFSGNNLLEIYKLNATMIRKSLERRFDICFAFAIHPYSPLLMYMSGARIRVTAIGHGDCDEFNGNRLTAFFMQLATHFFKGNAYGYHRADRFFSCLESLVQLPITNRKLEAWYSPTDFSLAKDYLRNAGKPIYALCMGGSGQRKHYPPIGYAQLLKMIIREEPTATFVILGGGQIDLNYAEIIKKIIPSIYENHVIDLTNKINYRQSAAVMSLCDMYIGNDTGTVHVAVAVNCPVLMLNCFPADLPISHNDTPRRWYPYGVPSVIVQPKYTLPECKNLKFYDPYGCKASFPHCITQIEPKTILNGFHLLKERAAKKINEPLYIH